MLESIFEKPFASLFIAPRFSGKTYLLIQLLNSAFFRRSFDEIYVFSETATLDDSWKDLKNKNVFLTDEFSEAALDNLMTSLKAEKAAKSKIPHVLIVLDDLADRFKPHKTSVLSNLAIKGRHFNISYIFTSQKYRFLPSAVRSNSLVKLFWYINNQREIDAIVEENFAKDMPEGFLRKLLEDSTEGFNYLVLKQHKKTQAFIGNGLMVSETKTA